MSWKPATAAVALVVVLGTSGCGGDDEKSARTPSPSGSTTASGGSTPTSTPTATGTASSPAVGLPKAFPPQAEVPLVSGVVTKQEGGKNPNGKVGWIIELASEGSRKQCFDKAAAALVAAGFTKQGELDAGDTRQAQFTTTKWAVIISARADGDNCQLGYEVGQLGP